MSADQHHARRILELLDRYAADRDDEARRKRTPTSRAGAPRRALDGAARRTPPSPPARRKG